MSRERGRDTGRGRGDGARPRLVLLKFLEFGLKKREQEFALFETDLHWRGVLILIRRKESRESRRQSTQTHRGIKVSWLFIVFNLIERRGEKTPHLGGNPSHSSGREIEDIL
jgi:hypothetical protein